MKKSLMMLTVAALAMAAVFAQGSKEGGSAASFDTNHEISVLSREDGSGTRGAFIELTGIQAKDASGKKIDRTTSEAGISNSTNVIMTNVANDQYAIGYASLGSLNDTVKALKIDGAEATVENIKNGSYTIARPFNVAYHEAKLSPVAKDFLAYIMSKDGQAVVTANKYIAVSDNDYKSAQPSGKVVVAGSSSVSPVMEKLIEAYKSVNPNAKIELQTSDSTVGVTNAIEGNADLGMASRNLKDTESSKVEHTTIAMDGIAVIVNNANPTDGCTKDSVRDIYIGQITKWSEVK